MFLNAPFPDCIGEVCVIYGLTYPLLLGFSHITHWEVKGHRRELKIHRRAMKFCYIVFSPVSFRM